MKKKTGRKSKDDLFVEAMEDWDDDLIAGYKLAVIKRIESLSIEDFRIWWGVLIKEKLDLPVGDISEKEEISIASVVKAARKKLKKAGQNEESAQHENK